MKEVYVAEVFAELCNSQNFHLYTLVNTANAGWPDRMVQMFDSKVMMVEFKLVDILKNGLFRPVGLRMPQAAWFAKWQHRNGLGCLFVGCDKGYMFITCMYWKDWLYVREKQFSVKQLSHDKRALRQELGSFLHRKVIKGCLT